MLKHLLCAAVVVCVMAASVLAETKSGKVELKESDFPPKGAPNVEMGQTVKLTANFYISEFFGSKIINAVPRVKNTGDKPMHVLFNVAFFDADGKLLGCVSQGSFSDEGLAAGEETQLGSCLIKLPEAELKKVKSFQASFYESEQKF
jgi:hypothetical protein